MKLIIAIIRSENLGRVEAALNQRNVCVLSVSQVLGSGWEPGYKEMYRGREICKRRIKLRLEMTVQDAHTDATVEAILRAQPAADGPPAADGSVFVLNLDGESNTRNHEAAPALVDAKT